MRICTAILIGTAVAVAGPFRAGAEAPSSQPADLCTRPAAAAAFAELMSRLLRLPMTGGATVGQWIGSRADAVSAMRAVAAFYRQV
ncbi:MAG TPA: hypothetical protein PLC79_12540, partial [Phycisphaerae bacterium]|nr:hypothetical protein [Phycisphaerae bacterium]